jgi:hypothetical protein
LRCLPSRKLKPQPKSPSLFSLSGEYGWLPMRASGPLTETRCAGCFISCLVREPSVVWLGRLGACLGGWPCVQFSAVLVAVATCLPLGKCPLMAPPSHLAPRTSHLAPCTASCTLHLAPASRDWAWARWSLLYALAHALLAVVCGATFLRPRRFCWRVCSDRLSLVWCSLCSMTAAV